MLFQLGMYQRPIMISYQLADTDANEHVNWELKSKKILLNMELNGTMVYFLVLSQLLFYHSEPLLVHISRHGHKFSLFLHFACSPMAIGFSSMQTYQRVNCMNGASPMYWCHPDFKNSSPRFICGLEWNIIDLKLSSTFTHGSSYTVSQSFPCTGFDAGSCLNFLLMNLCYI